MESSYLYLVIKSPVDFLIIAGMPSTIEKLRSRLVGYKIYIIGKPVNRLLDGVLATDIRAEIDRIENLVQI